MCSITLPQNRFTAKQWESIKKMDAAAEFSVTTGSFAQA
jgi:hypothetical protein